MPRKKKGDEGIEAATAKALYIEMGTHRSLAKLCKLLKRPDGYTRDLERWSSKFGWVEAARNHDLDLIQQEAARQRAEVAEAIDKLNKAQADVAFGLFVKASKFISELIDTKVLFGRDAVILWKEAAALQRLAVGASSERLQVELSGNPDAPLIIETVWGTGVVVESDKGDKD